jgi:eukaryotic translation initiation factor 2C
MANTFGANVPKAAQLVFIVIQGASTELYKMLKYALDTQFGVPSQVMLEERAFRERGQDQYLANIAMKVNVKLGGINCIAAEPYFESARTMLLGGDISHTSPGAMRAAAPPPSTAALVGTWDKACTAYTAVAAAQPSGLNLIQNVKPMMQVLLGRYMEKNQGELPRRILFYRDGASESEFQTILEHEVAPLKELLNEKNANCKITVIMAIKVGPLQCILL